MFEVEAIASLTWLYIYQAIFIKDLRLVSKEKKTFGIESQNLVNN